MFQRIGYLRGFVGISLTWGILWSSVNTLALLVRWLPKTPEGVTRTSMAFSILSNQTVSAFLWGTLLGALFSVAVTMSSDRLSAKNPLRPRRLMGLGAIAGLVLGAIVANFSSSFDIAATVVISLTSASVGALLGVASARAKPKLTEGDEPMRLPTA